TTALHRVFIDVAIAWTNKREKRVLGFVNTCESNHGTHVEGIWCGLAHAFDMKRWTCIREIFEPGIVSVVSVTLATPENANPTREILTTARARRAVKLTVSDLISATRYEPELARFYAERMPVTIV